MYSTPAIVGLSWGLKISPSLFRAHAVKPLSTIDNQTDFKDNFASAKIAEGAQVSMKAPDAKGTGPYSQLTHEELVNLLERQKDQLSQKDTKIMELEQYIDNLLVRVIEENPSILMSLTLMKKSVWGTHQAQGFWLVYSLTVITNMGWQYKRWFSVQRHYTKASGKHYWAEDQVDVFLIYDVSQYMLMSWCDLPLV